MKNAIFGLSESYYILFYVVDHLSTENPKKKLNQRF